jgi:mRNA interferase MazF
LEKKFGNYIPDVGDIVWLNFNPQTGREQADRRPAICISPRIYNQKSGLALFCPITSKIKGYPFEIRIKVGKIDGVILADQIRSLDYRERNTMFEGKAPEEIVLT